MSKDKLEEIINRRPSRWGNLALREFNRDMRILQERAKQAEFLERSIRNLQYENRHKMELEKQNERYCDAFQDILVVLDWKTDNASRLVKRLINKALEANK